MFSDSVTTRRFLLAFVVTWLIHFSLGLISLGLSNVLLVNFFYTIGGGQYAPANEAVAAFVRVVPIFAPTLALIVALSALASLFIASKLAAKYPRNRYSVYAFSGAVVALAFGLLTLSFNWLGAVIGAVALLPAARIARPQ